MEHYYEHLQRDGPADGLEVLLVSLVLNLLVNVILDDIVWITSKSALDFRNPTILVANAGAFVCLALDSMDGHLSDHDTTTTDSVDCDKSKEEVAIPPSLVSRPKGGRPLAAEKENVSGSGSMTDTNPDTEFVKSSVVQVKGRTWKVSPQSCSICQVTVKMKKALVFHLKQYHPESRSYRCLHCEGAYNNADDLASHFSNAHSVKNIQCKYCAYTATTVVRMHIHICRHTSGVCCKQCGKAYPNLHSLHVHIELHGTRTEHPCATCTKVFASAHSLHIHCKGQHGEGYACHCGAIFASPAQQA